MRLLVVDGSNLLFQMFFGMPTKIISRGGKDVRGVVGFVGALLRIIRLVSPTHICVLFDGESHNPRVDLSVDYKANRPDWSQVSDDENPFTQEADIYRAVDYLGIPRYVTEDCEADDIVAAYAAHFPGEVIISSQDSDFFQLISPRVRVLRYRGENTVICDCDYIVKKLGVLPSQYADYKALVGDSSDNIKGIRGIGPKTAAKLISEHGSIEWLLNNLNNIEKSKIREAILEDADRLVLNQRLITLGHSQKLPFFCDELAFTLPPISSGEILRDIGIF